MTHSLRTQQHSQIILSALSALIAVCVLSNPAAAQQTAFSYQGKLTDAGNAANGNYDLQFKLFDTVTVGAGAQQGATLVLNPVTASAGVFAVQLDFGANVFSGADRYLEIGVRPAGDGGAYSVLAPRQPITAAPYAIQTLNAEKLGGLPASGFVQNSGSGTVNSIPVWSTGTTLGNSQITQSVNGVQLPNNVQLGVGAQGNSVQFGSPNSETGMSIQGVSGIAELRFDGTLKLVNGPGSGVPPATNGIAITSAGNVGIGTTNPATKLHVLSTASAIYGQSTNGSGVYGESGIVNSVAGAGVYGRATSSGGTGVIGESNINNAVGVYGVSTSPTGFGMYARNNFGGRALFAEGNAGQSRDKGGWAKAMIYVQANGMILRCYNGVTNSSTGNCGFVVSRITDGRYSIDFNFQVDDRFFTITVKDPNYMGNHFSAGYIYVSGEEVEVITSLTNSNNYEIDDDFMIIVF